MKPTNIAQNEPGSENIQYIASSVRICSTPPIRWSEEFLQDVRHVALKNTQYQAGIASLNTNSADSGNSASNANGDDDGDGNGDSDCNSDGDSDGEYGGDGNSAG